jgi:hypothetical protein
MMADQLMRVWQRTWPTLVGFAVVASLVAIGMSMNARDRAIMVTCEQTKDLRSDLVVVLRETMEVQVARMEDESPADRRAVDVARARAFYRAQVARIGPVQCP